MSIDPRSTDYTSFEYLEPHADYEPFELARQVERVPSSPIELSEDQEEVFRQLLRDEVYISLHEHVGVFPQDISQTPRYVKAGRMATAFEGLAASHWDVVFDNLLDGICTIHSSVGWQWDDVLHDLGMRLCDLAHQDLVLPIRSTHDIRRAKSSNRVGWVASMEGAAMIENDLDRIDLLFGFGVRLLGVTYSEANALGSGLREPRDGGLTVFGRQAVARMNKVGMLIDCSHCGDQTTRDVIATSELPIVLSHIGARALEDSNRLAPDDVLVACAEKGGVIGIEAAPHTTVSPDHPEHSLESVLDHFDYIRSLVGIDHVTFGPDTVYGDHVGLHETYAANLSIKESRAHSSDEMPQGEGEDPQTERPKVPYVAGLENPTEGSANLLRALIARGEAADDIAKVMGRNVLRVLDAVWPA